MENRNVQFLLSFTEHIAIILAKTGVHHRRSVRMCDNKFISPSSTLGRSELSKISSECFQEELTGFLQYPK